MQITSILSRLSDLAGFGHPKQPVESASRKTLDAAGGALPSPAAAPSRLQEILARYDVSDISPRAFSELLQTLHQAGFLPDNDLQDLSQARLDLEREGIGPDDHVNLVEIYTKRLRALQQESKELEDKLRALGYIR